MFATTWFRIFRLPSTNIKSETYKTVVFLVLLNVCGTWSFTLMEEHKFRTFRFVCFLKNRGFGNWLLPSTGESMKPNLLCPLNKTDFSP